MANEKKSPKVGFLPGNFTQKQKSPLRPLPAMPGSVARMGKILQRFGTQTRI